MSFIIFESQIKAETSPRTFVVGTRPTKATMLSVESVRGHRQLLSAAEVAHVCLHGSCVRTYLRRHRFPVVQPPKHLPTSISCGKLATQREDNQLTSAPKYSSS